MTGIVSANMNTFLPSFSQWNVSWNIEKIKEKIRDSQSLYRSPDYHWYIGSFQEIAFIDILVSFSSWIPIHIRNVNFTISIHVKFWFNHVRCHKLKTTEMVTILDFDLCEKCQLYKDNPVIIQFIYRLRSIMLVDCKKKLLFIFTYLIVLYWKLRRWQSSISDPHKQCHLCKKPFNVQFGFNLYVFLRKKLLFIFP